MRRRPPLSEDDSLSGAFRSRSTTGFGSGCHRYRGRPGVELVHAHTPSASGMAGQRLAGKLDTRSSRRITRNERVRRVRLVQRCRVSGPLQRRELRTLVPGPCRHRYRAKRARSDPSPGSIGLDTTVTVVPNGVDTTAFAPMPRTSASDTTSRMVHSWATPAATVTRNLDEIVTACEGLDVTVVFAGDGPARESLEATAEHSDADVRFLGFLDRVELPELYSALDVFAFPSPVETQGLVALEANAAGRPSSVSTPAHSRHYRGRRNRLHLRRRRYRRLPSSYRARPRRAGTSSRALSRPARYD